MNKFCRYCGAQLRPNARFCATCGAQVAAPPTIQAQTAVPQPVQAQAVASRPVPTRTPVPPPAQARPDPPPAPSAPRPPAAEKARVNGGQATASVTQLAGSAGQGASSAARFAGGAIAAPPGAGEITLGIPRVAGEVAQIAQAMNPARVLTSGAWDIVRGIRSAFRDKKKWIPVLALSGVWFVLSLLPYLEINSEAVQALSWLTFARGGMGLHGDPGLAEMAGGVLGKGVVAGLLFSLLSTGTLGSMGAGLKTLLSSFASVGSGGIVALLCGVGVALIGYNFMAGAAVSSMSMAGIAAFLLSLRALGSKAGFLRSFLGGLTARKTGTGKSIDATAVNRVMAGMTMGFALSVPLSALDLPTFHLPYLLGGLLLIAGAVLGIAKGNGKEAAAP